MSNLESKLREMEKRGFTTRISDPDPEDNPLFHLQINAGERIVYQGPVGYRGMERECGEWAVYWTLVAFTAGLNEV